MAHKLIFRSCGNTNFRQCLCRLSTKAKKTYDLIGPPHPVSNLRSIKVARREKETELEKHLRLKREEVEKWNHLFWFIHNQDFSKQKEIFISNELKKKDKTKQSLNADEMSIFYKRFLDDNWKKHKLYNFEWYKKNFHLAALDLRVKIQRLFS